MNTDNELQARSETAKRRVSIIIPYYQRSAGILARALASVMAQDLPSGTTQRVIVIDDESPAPVEPELAELTQEQRQTVIVLRQPNGGPGAARNTGLDYVARDGADFIAFLDSDDTWRSNHVAEALRILDQGFDFYFCDHHRFDDSGSYSSFTKSLIALRNEAKQSAVIDHVGPVIKVDNEVLFSSYLTDYLSQTSTVVLRASSVVDARFDQNLRSAGEDHMYWLLLASRGLRTAISYNCNVHCGRGLNIYFEAFDFSSEKVVNRVGSVLLFYLTVRQAFSLSAQDRVQLESMIKRYRRGYSYLMLLLLAKRRLPSLSLFVKLHRLDPSLGVMVPIRALSVVPNRKQEALGW